MKQFGLATVIGLDGAYKLNGAATFAAATVEQAEAEGRAEVEELTDGYKELLGFHVANERDVYDLTIVPRAATPGADALTKTVEALRLPPIPSKVTIKLQANTLTATQTKGALGYSTEVGAGDEIHMIYAGGARRTMMNGKAALRLQAFIPKTSPLTVDNLLTLALATA